jgi:hypothetical protein
MAYPPPPPPYGTPVNQPPTPPYGTPGAPPTDPGTNGFAVAGLVCGILALCGVGLLSVIFGIIALVQIKKTGQKGRGMAIAGIAITGAWVAVGVVAAIVVVAIGVGAERDDDGIITDGGRMNITALRPGDCIEELREGRAIDTVPAVPCSEPHIGEVYATFDLADGDWPGEDIVFEEAELGCLDLLFDHSQTAFDDETVDIFYIHPTRTTWRTGDREVVCITYYLDGPRTGSIQSG